jgi:predicted O-methyltransferase YrrM
VFQQTIRDAGVADAVVPLKMKSVDGAKNLAERGVRLRFLFLDGAHDEESVAEDLVSFLPLLEPGALIAFDDARPDGNFPGVYKAYQRILGDRSQELAWGGAVLIVQLSETSPQLSKST